MRLAINFDVFFQRVHDPNFGDCCASVSWKFLLAVVMQGGIGDFDQQKDVLGVRVLSV